MKQSKIAITENKENLIFSNGTIEILYNLKSGLADYFWKDKLILKSVYTLAKLQEDKIIRSDNYDNRIFLKDEFEEATKITIKNSSEGQPTMLQNFYIYEDKAFIMLDVIIENESENSTNFITPFMLDTVQSTAWMGSTDKRVLFVPFDNDKWIRYEAKELKNINESYEVTAIYDNHTRNGFVLGSLTHDIWKTGINVIGDEKEQISKLSIFNGVANDITRDSLPHGSIKSKTLKSSKIFLGFFEDYRKGLEQYGKTNSELVPALPWNNGVPFGWNSWGAVAKDISFDLYTKTSDFIKKELQPKSFSNEGTNYVNFDAGWNNLTEDQLIAAVKHVHANGQKAGTYFTPFTYWGWDYESAISETSDEYKYKDILLRDYNGNLLPRLATGLPIDPSHPGNLERVKNTLNYFIKLGFDYIKMDFMVHGAMEGDHHNKDIHTGIQAYNYGMKHIKDILDPKKIGRDIFISLSIAPSFPYQYAHARRVSCDVFGKINDTEYMLNSLTYSWWMNDSLYKYNDPDHTILFKSYNQDATTEEEARSRINSTAIAGTVVLNSDDIRREEAAERLKLLLTNEDVNQLARKGVSFRPIEGNTGNRSSDIFVLDDSINNEFYIAVFNFYEMDSLEKIINLERLGLNNGVSYKVYDLWEKASKVISSDFKVILKAKQSKILKLSWNK